MPNSKRYSCVANEPTSSENKVWFSSYFLNNIFFVFISIFRSCFLVEKFLREIPIIVMLSSRHEQLNEVECPQKAPHQLDILKSKRSPKEKLSAKFEKINSFAAFWLAARFCVCYFTFLCFYFFSRSFFSFTSLFETIFHPSLIFFFSSYISVSHHYIHHHLSWLYGKLTRKIYQFAKWNI